MVLLSEAVWVIRLFFGQWITDKSIYFEPLDFGRQIFLKDSCPDSPACHRTEANAFGYTSHFSPLILAGFPYPEFWKVRNTCEKEEVRWDGLLMNDLPVSMWKHLISGDSGAIYSMPGQCQISYMKVKLLQSSRKSIEYNECVSKICIKHILFLDELC